MLIELPGQAGRISSYSGVCFPEEVRQDGWMGGPVEDGQPVSQRVSDGTLTLPFSCFAGCPGKGWGPFGSVGPEMTPPLYPTLCQELTHTVPSPEEVTV